MDDHTGGLDVGLVRGASSAGVERESSEHERQRGHRREPERRLAPHGVLKMVMRILVIKKSATKIEIETTTTVRVVE